VHQNGDDELDGHGATLATLELAAWLFHSKPALMWDSEFPLSDPPPTPQGANEAMALSASRARVLFVGKSSSRRLSSISISGKYFSRIIKR